MVVRAFFLSTPYLWGKVPWSTSHKAEIRLVEHNLGWREADCQRRRPESQWCGYLVWLPLSPDLLLCWLLGKLDEAPVLGKLVTGTRDLAAWRAFYGEAWEATECLSKLGSH